MYGPRAVPKAAGAKRIRAHGGGRKPFSNGGLASAEFLHLTGTDDPALKLDHLTELRDRLVIRHPQVGHSPFVGAPYCPITGVAPVKATARTIHRSRILVILSPGTRPTTQNRHPWFM